MHHCPQKSCALLSKGAPPDLEAQADTPGASHGHLDTQLSPSASKNHKIDAGDRDWLADTCGLCKKEQVPRDWPEK